MESSAPVPRAPNPEAVEFVRFCRARRHVTWPTLYDEMWAVATRGLFRGYDFAELAELGIEFGLTGMPMLAALAREVIEREPMAPSARSVAAARRGLAVVSGVG